jgi:ABC-type transport system involved in cytochrome bd biosynthesis fused ATPase/permease subunit
MYARRRKRYFVLMATCLVLFISAWAFVRLLSVEAAVALCVVALAIPPFAVIIGNRREPDDHWFDEDWNPDRDTYRR